MVTRGFMLWLLRCLRRVEFRSLTYQLNGGELVGRAKGDYRVSSWVVLGIVLVTVLALVVVLWGKLYLSFGYDTFSVTYARVLEPNNVYHFGDFESIDIVSKGYWAFEEQVGWDGVDKLVANRELGGCYRVTILVLAWDWLPLAGVRVEVKKESEHSLASLELPKYIDLKLRDLDGHLISEQEFMHRGAHRLHEVFEMTYERKATGGFALVASDRFGRNSYYVDESGAIRVCTQGVAGSESPIVGSQTNGSVR